MRVCVLVGCIEHLKNAVYALYLSTVKYRYMTMKTEAPCNNEYQCFVNQHKTRYMEQTLVPRNCVCGHVEEMLKIV